MELLNEALQEAANDVATAGLEEQAEYSSEQEHDNHASDDVIYEGETFSDVSTGEFKKQHSSRGPTFIVNKDGTFEIR